MLIWCLLLWCLYFFLLRWYCCLKVPIRVWVWIEVACIHIVRNGQNTRISMRRAKKDLAKLAPRQQKIPRTPTMKRGTKRNSKNSGDSAYTDNGERDQEKIEKIWPTMCASGCRRLLLTIPMPPWRCQNSQIYQSLASPLSRAFPLNVEIIKSRMTLQPWKITSWMANLAYKWSLCGPPQISTSGPSHGRFSATPTASSPTCEVSWSRSTYRFVRWRVVRSLGWRRMTQGPRQRTAWIRETSFATSVLPPKIEDLFTTGHSIAFCSFLQRGEQHEKSETRIMFNVLRLTRGITGQWWNSCHPDFSREKRLEDIQQHLDKKYSEFDQLHQVEACHSDFRYSEWC